MLGVYPKNSCAPVVFSYFGPYKEILPKIRTIVLTLTRVLANRCLHIKYDKIVNIPGVLNFCRVSLDILATPSPTQPPAFTTWNLLIGFTKLVASSMAWKIRPPDGGHYWIWKRRGGTLVDLRLRGREARIWTRASRKGFSILDCFLTGRGLGQERQCLMSLDSPESSRVFIWKYNES